jgi:hypothetical protein
MTTIAYGITLVHFCLFDTLSEKLVCASTTNNVVIKKPYGPPLPRLAPNRNLFNSIRIQCS